MSIIDLNQAINDRTPHNTGVARCLQCGYEWVATAPVGEVWLECQACHMDKGSFVGPCYPHDGMIWQCCCGNELFLITSNGALCPICGRYSDPD